MKQRVKFLPPDYTLVTTDWSKLVYSPFREGHILEAFASADALIDDLIETNIRQLYSDAKCQDLINEIHFLRGRVNFDSLVLLEILKSKTAVDEEFVNRVRQFKKARNLVVHSPEGEYALVIGIKKYSSQEELDEMAEKEARMWIGAAYEIFAELLDVSRKISRNQEYYFSKEFYGKNPRSEIAKRNYPKKK